MLLLMRTSFHTVLDTKKIDLPELPSLNNDSQPVAPEPTWDVYVPIPISHGNTLDLDDANPALDQEPWFPPMSLQRPWSPLDFDSLAHPPSYRTDFSPLHPGIQHDWPETGHRSDIEDWHQYKRYMLTSSISLFKRRKLLVKPIPQGWFPSRQQSGESIPEFQSCPHQHHPTYDDRSTFRPPVVQWRSTCISQPQFLPDNAYGNCPTAQIERDINQELDPIQEESSPQEESSMDIMPAKTVQRPTNKLEDLGEMYSSEWMQHHFALAVDQEKWTISKQYQDIAKLPWEQQKSWYNATKDKIKSLHDRKVWDLVDLPKGWQSVKGRWIFAIQCGNHVKACFVVKGFTQIFRIDYKETFSPVARFETICLVLALAALHDWEIEALDVKTTFLFDELDEEIYMVQPEDFIAKDQESKVCHLQKAIYGLKQAAFQWNKLLHKSLVDFDFKNALLILVYMLNS